MATPSRHYLLVRGLSKGPDVGSSDPGPRGPKLKKLMFNLFWAPGALPNRCALKFHATHAYFRNFWWHGMNILIFDVPRPKKNGCSHVFFRFGRSPPIALNAQKQDANLELAYFLEKSRFEFLN